MRAFIFPANTVAEPLAPRQYTNTSSQPSSRLHYAVPSVGTIKNNEVVKIECVDWTGGQIGNNDSADDMRDVDLTKIHYLTGPFDIETAEPGDVLVLEIQDASQVSSRRTTAEASWTRSTPSRRSPHQLYLECGTDPAQRKSYLGLRRHLLLLTPHPRRPLRGADPPWHPGLRALCRSPRNLEQARR
jgi:hypothetical protein